METVRKRIRIDDLKSVKRLLSKLMNEIYYDEILPSKADSIGKLCNSYIKIFDIESKQKLIEKIDLKAEISETEMNEILDKFKRMTA